MRSGSRVAGTARSRDEQTHGLPELLDSGDPDERVTAVELLGEIGDETDLAELRVRLRAVDREMRALITTVGTLKRRCEPG